MKTFKIFVVSFVLLFFVGAITSCKEKIKSLRGMVSNVEYKEDTIINISVANSSDTLVFNMDRAQFNNGIMIPGDSVIVDYYNGKNDTMRCAYVTLLPKVSKEVDLDTLKDKPLLTR